MLIQTTLRTRSIALLDRVEERLPRIMTLWFLMALTACAARIAISPLQSLPDVGTFLPYVLLVGAPLVSMGLALKWFERGDELPQPSVRLARVGRWTDVSARHARRHPLYGSSGIMLSLLIGMLLNVPVRSLEYLASVPALAGSVPHWLSTLRLAMTADVVILSSLYTICFVAALRRVPMFPRLLILTWLVDAAMQLGIGQAVRAAGGVPPSVGDALSTLLDGNIKKVAISVGLWLPYLLLSKRVNVTFRHRVAIRKAAR
ncbi:hypothetical protein [Sphingomonas jaspsi]|uniref:hypothetical protein n=1 Tax=Sphingomonas jaspsi TaxID=392409 RepID=UPI0004B0ECF8|nr:hypothetical protein [Sphingomonas jaspsi]